MGYRTDVSGVECWQLFVSDEGIKGTVYPHCGMPIKMKIEKGDNG